jgi:transposase
MDVAIGVDAHKASLAVAIVDSLGGIRAVREFSNDPNAHRRLLRWVRGFGEARIVGIEGAGSYGAGLARYLIAAGEDVREVSPNLTFSERKRRPARGKTDIDDAVAIARVVVRDRDALTTAERDRLSDDLKALVDHHDQLSRARTQNINRAHKHLVVMYPGYHQRVGKLTTKTGLRQTVALLRGDRSVRADLIRSHIAEIRRFDDQLRASEHNIAKLIEVSGSSLVDEIGIGPFVAATILGEVGNVRRLRSRASFARLNASAPIPASSGQTNRHRLNRGGNRELNRALHVIAINRLRLDPASRDYVARKCAEGKSKKDAVRCLKRRISDVVYRRLMADADHLTLFRVITGARAPLVMRG